MVAVSLYTPEAEWIDHLTQMLQRAGNPKANRSLVIREAMARRQEDLQDKRPQEALQSFIARHAARMEASEYASFESIIKTSEVGHGAR